MENEYRNYTIIRIQENSEPAANGCRLWTGTKNAGGYGLISITFVKGKRVMMSAHRALYLATTGILLPSTTQILHKCDIPACVEFNHLFKGTAEDNARDCVSKGRRADKHRAHRRVRIFTDEQIEAIRSTPGKLRHVAEQFGTTSGYVSKLRNGKAKTFA